MVVVLEVVDGARLVQKSGNQLEESRTRLDKAAAGAGQAVDDKPSCNNEFQMKNIVKDKILRDVFQVKRRG